MSYLRFLLPLMLFTTSTFAQIGYVFDHNAPPKIREYLVLRDTFLLGHQDFPETLAAPPMLLQEIPPRPVMSQRQPILRIPDAPDPEKIRKQYPRRRNESEEKYQARFDKLFLKKFEAHQRIEEREYKRMERYLQDSAAYVIKKAAYDKAIQKQNDIDSNRLNYLKHVYKTDRELDFVYSVLKLDKDSLEYHQAYNYPSLRLGDYLLRLSEVTARINRNFTATSDSQFLALIPHLTTLQSQMQSLSNEQVLKMESHRISNLDSIKYQSFLKACRGDVFASELFDAYHKKDIEGIYGIHTRFISKDLSKTINKYIYLLRENLIPRHAYYLQMHLAWEPLATKYLQIQRELDELELQHQLVSPYALSHSGLRATWHLFYPVF